MQRRGAWFFLLCFVQSALNRLHSVRHGDRETSERREQSSAPGSACTDRASGSQSEAHSWHIRRADEYHRCPETVVCLPHWMQFDLPRLLREKKIMKVSITVYSNTNNKNVKALYQSFLSCSWAPSSSLVGAGWADAPAYEVWRSSPALCCHWS